MEEKTKGIYKRNEGRWEARFRVGVNADGRARYRSVYAQTKEAVIAKRQAAEAEILAAKTRKRPTEFNLLIIGAGTHGRDVYEIARSLHVFRKISFLDDSVQGENIIGRCSDLLKYRSQYPCAFVAIGDNKLRRRYAELLREYNFLIPSIVSPAANVSAMAQIGDACKAMDCKMLYLSTDYVFDGQGTKAWKADCKDYKPLNVYGQTKLEGELAVSNTLEKYFIVRIAWVFGLNGKNFIKTMINVGKTMMK